MNISLHQRAITMTMSLEDFLKPVLPSHDYQVIHIQSNPRETHPLTPGKGTTTIKTQHFIALSNNRQVFFALELFAYTSINHSIRTIDSLLFVSKADTNAQNHTKVKVGLVTSEILKYILRIPVTNYLKNVVPARIQNQSAGAITRTTSTKSALKLLIERASGRTLPSLVPPQPAPYDLKIDNYHHTTKIGLFTRPEAQYLFPGSENIKSKHLLTGEQLLKWWLGVLDSVLVSEFKNDSLAKVRIPGEDYHKVSRFLTGLKYEWSVGDIFGDGDDLAVKCVPLLPDDPKTRFLEHLVVEGRINFVKLSQFWNELQIRQEFALGTTVSVIGIEGHLKQNDNSFCSQNGLLLTHKQFKKVKTYIVGEDYSSEEGSLEAYTNVADYLMYKFNHSIPSFRGESISRERKGSGEKKPVVINLNASLVRKKAKKE